MSFHQPPSQYLCNSKDQRSGMPWIAQAKRDAKRLLAAWTAHDANTCSRIQAVWRDAVAPSLQRVQHVIAIESGYESWTAMVASDPDGHLKDMHRRSACMIHDQSLSLPIGSLVRPGHASVMRAMGYHDRRDPFWLDLGGIQALPTHLPHEWPCTDIRHRDMGGILTTAHASIQVADDLAQAMQNAGSSWSACVVDPSLVLVIGSPLRTRHAVVSRIIASMASMGPVLILSPWPSQRYAPCLHGSRGPHTIMRRGCNNAEVSDAMRSISVEPHLMVIDGMDQWGGWDWIIPWLDHGHRLVVAGDLDPWAMRSTPPSWAHRVTHAICSRSSCTSVAPMHRLPGDEVVIAHAWGHLMTMDARTLTHVRVNADPA
jgi:hypothetical protein